MNSKYYVTTPIYYVNAPPHMGTGYTTILADVLARYHRRNGVESRLVTGSDEHSQNIADKAAAEGITPKEFCDRLIPQFHEAWDLLEIGPYEFVRTSGDSHRHTVQTVFSRIREVGDIYKAEYSGWYHTTDNRFLDESEVPESPEKDPRLKFLTEDAYFFRLSKYQDFLLEYHRENPQAIVPDFRRNEMLNRIKEGLRDLCISRSSTDWGIPLPWDPEHVFYVWGDALFSYITGSGFDVELACGNAAAGKDPLEGQPETNFWPCQAHIMAKDIPWFHTIVWPALLQSAGLPLPKSCLVHGYWNFDGAKMSKSLGNVFNPVDAVGLVQAAGVRYFVLREAPTGSDGNFSVEALAKRYNYDLANDFGNLVHRLITMGNRFRQGTISPAVGESAEHQALMKDADSRFERVLEDFASYRFKEALENIWELVRALNRLIDEEKPWELNKGKNEGDAARLDSFFAVSLQVLRKVLGLLSPVMPGVTRGLYTQLGYPGDWERLTWDDFRAPLSGPWKLGQGEILLPKLDLENLEQELSERKEPKVEKTADKNVETKVEGPAYIGYEDWTKIRIIAVKVVKAEVVEGADKLLRLTVDDGTRQDRTIVSGIRKDYTPEDMTGRTIFILDNLKPRKIFGIVSEGMLVAAGGQGDPVTLVAPINELAPGTPLG
ncbi:MAG: methionine--tRNA ligase [Vulcanimicrobiota bacterium]